MDSPAFYSFAFAALLEQVPTGVESGVSRTASCSLLICLSCFQCFRRLTCTMLLAYAMSSPCPRDSYRIAFAHHHHHHHHHHHYPQATQETKKNNNNDTTATRSSAPLIIGLQMFGACLDDADIGVRVAALKAACSFLQDSLPGVVCVCVCL